MRFNIISTILLLCSLSYATVTKTISGNLKVTGALLSADGTVGAPGMSFSGDTDTGFYRSGSNAIEVAGAGAQIGEFSGSGFESKFRLYTSDGSVGAPAFAFSVDQDNGLYRIGTNNPALAAGGTKVIDMKSTGVAILGTTTNDSAATGFVGETVECNITQGSPTTLTDDDYTDLCTLSLGAGDWIINGQATFVVNGATTPAECYTVILPTANGNQSGSVAGKDTVVDDCSALSGTKVRSIHITLRYSAAGATTEHFKARFNSASAATTQAYGYAVAQRIR